MERKVDLRVEILVGNLEYFSPAETFVAFC